jgi:glycosyltransferase involved in cell wall biosynthesis
MFVYLRNTYDAKCSPLLPLADPSLFSNNSTGTKNPEDVLQIAYTGAIYAGQIDSVQRLVNVLQKEPSQEQMQLTLCTTLSEAALRRLRVLAKNILVEEVGDTKIPQVLARANMLFLPLSFDVSQRHCAAISFPSEIAEYLASRVPILAHVPSYSPVARYCREYGCVLVADEPNEDALRDALVRLGSDAELRRELSAMGLEAARKNHDANQIAPAFLPQLNNIGK